MKTLSLKNKIFVFWGCMDILAVIIYFAASLYGGRIPFYSDIEGFYKNIASMNVSETMLFYLQFLFLLNILMNLSLFYSSYAFVVKKNMGVTFFCCQEVLRIFSITCSLSFIPILLRFVDGYPWYLGVSFFIFSEVCKVSAFLWCKKSP